MTLTQRNAIASPAAGLQVIVTGETGGEFVSMYNSSLAAWVREGALSSITAATSSNIINNAGNPQKWNWNSLANDTAFILESNATTATASGQVLISSTLKGANAASSVTTKAASFSNTKTGTTSTNIGAYFNASGGTNNYAAVFDGGSVGVGTQTPVDKFSIVGGNASLQNASNTAATSLLLKNDGGTVGSANAYGSNFSLTDYRNTVSFASINSLLLMADQNSNGPTTTREIRFRPGGFAVAGQIMKMKGNGIMIERGADNNPNGSAILDVTSTTQGVLFPRMTTTQKLAIGSPAAGLQVYDTTLNQMSYYNGTTWVNF
jgi:hypothetical protein